MRIFFGVTLLLLGAAVQSAPVVIDFEEFTPDVAINPPSGDMTSKGFTFDYLDQGSGNPVVSSAGGSPNGTQGYINCPNCQLVEQIDVFQSSGSVFSLQSIDLAAVNTVGNFDFIFTGFKSGGGTVTQSALAVSALQTLNFDSSWTNLDSFRIEIEANSTTLFTASFIDNVSVDAVPIPAAVWLFGSGLAGLGFLRRKKS